MIIKKGKPIPDDNHLIRRVPSSRLRKDPNGNVIGILWQAFQLRPGEASLSANRLEHFTGDMERRISLMVNDFRKTLTLKPKDGFAIGNVAKIKDQCAIRNSKIYVVSDPRKSIPSHVSLNGWPEAAELLEIIAAEAWNDWRLNKDIPDL